MRMTSRLLATLSLACFLAPAAAFAEDAKPDENKAAAQPAAAAETAQGGKKKVVFLAGGPSHGFGNHDHLAGCTLLAKRLNEDVPGFEAVVVQGWPQDPKALEGVSAVVMYSDGGPGHFAKSHIKELNDVHKAGGGIGAIHYAVEIPADEGGEFWAKWMGGYFETHYSVNPFWTADFKKLPEHKVAAGVAPFSTHDEWYYNMRFRKDQKGVTMILSAVPPDDTRTRDFGPHSGNPHVRKGVGKNQEEHVLWIAENENGSRGFGTTGGHVHLNWAHDQWRNTVLNAIVWIAKGEIPEGGVKSKRPTVEEMLSNHDEPVPADLNKDEWAKKIEEMNKPKESKEAAAAPAGK